MANARSAGTSNIDVGCTGLIASKLAPTGLVPFESFMSDANTVGAGLPAMAACQSTSMLEVPAPSRASLSYRLGAVRIIHVRRKNCRSWLASDSGLSVNIDVGGTGLIASKLAPTGLVPFESFMSDAKTVGAGLPAMAACQSTSMLDVPASSRASLLLQAWCRSNHSCPTQTL